MDTTIDNDYGMKRDRQKLTEKLNIPSTLTGAKGQVVPALWLAAKDVLLGTLVGAGIGVVVLKRHCLWVGFLVAASSYYAGKPGLASLGVGMMSSGFLQFTGVPGAKTTEGATTQTAKDRFALFKEELKQKFFLDKMGKKKTETTPTDVPADEGGATNGLGNFDALAEMEAQLLSEAVSAKRQAMEGVKADMDFDEDFAEPGPPIHKSGLSFIEHDDGVTLQPNRPLL